MKLIVPCGHYELEDWGQPSVSSSQKLCLIGLFVLPHSSGLVIKYYFVM